MGKSFHFSSCRNKDLEPVRFFRFPDFRKFGTWSLTRFLPQICCRSWSFFSIFVVQSSSGKGLENAPLRIVTSGQGHFRALARRRHLGPATSWPTLGGHHALTRSLLGHKSVSLLPLRKAKQKKKKLQKFDTTRGARRGHQLYEECCWPGLVGLTNRNPPRPLWPNDVRIRWWWWWQLL